MENITSRYTQPALLWALVAEYAAKKWPDKPIGHTELALYLYPSTGAGAWYMHGPKLYWQDEPVTGDHFTNCDKGALTGADIADVVLMHRRMRASIRWDSLDNAVRAMRVGKTGRPPISDEGPSTTHSVRLPNAMWEQIPEPRADWIRAAIEERMQK
jgi:hypothetical protein